MSPSPSTASDQPTGPDVGQLGAFIRKRREALGISRRELARRAGVSQVALVESAKIQKPRTDTLAAIAQALDMSLTELLGMGKPESLPNFRPYMRTKYPNMPDAALADIDAYVRKLAKRYNITTDGPLNDEDEEVI